LVAFIAVFLLVALASVAESAIVEIPGEGAAVSGIGVVAGWKCPPNEDITITFDGGSPLPAATRLPRGDTAGACGNDGRNGYLIQFNYNLLGDGLHSVVVRQGGTVFARAGFRVTTLGESFLRGRHLTFDVPHFAGKRLTLGWSQASQSFQIVGTDAVEYMPYHGLMEQVSAVGPIYTTGSSLVSPIALEEAALMLLTMLAHRPDIVQRLRSAGALTAVFAAAEEICDLPYFAPLAGTPLCSNSPGGRGGVPGRPATACSEMNVLGLPGDEFGRGSRPDGENVCVHEIAHTIMNIGLLESDRAKIRARYDKVKQGRKWAGDFALENADEFFAEMSQVYFCANPDIPAFLHQYGINCAAELRSYDLPTYDLVNDIYRGAADLR
jgi:hypothetical protein